MKNIFICPGNCNSCELNLVCPQQGEFNEDTNLKDINPTWLIFRLNLSIPNLIQTVSISEDVKDIPVIEVSDMIKIITAKIPEEIYELMEDEYWEDVRNKINNVITIVAQRIVLATKNKCEATACLKCFMQKNCPQIKRQKP